jgi:hypothetical protein
MALKDYVIFLNNERAAENHTVVSTTGQKIFDIVNPYANDSGPRYIQPTPGGPFYVINWDSSWSKYGTEGELIFNVGSAFETYTNNIIRTAAFSANDTLYMLGRDLANADRATIWSVPSTAGLLDFRPTVFDYVGSGDPLFDDVVNTYAFSSVIFTFGGAQRYFVCVSNGASELKLISRALTGGAWTNHDLPVDLLSTFSVGISSITLEVVGSNIVAVVTGSDIPSGTPTYFVAPTSTLVWDAGTVIPCTTTTQLRTDMTEWRKFNILGDAIYMFVHVDSSAYSIAKFVVSTKSLTLTALPLTPLDTVVDSIRYVSRVDQNNELTPLSDGRWVGHADRWDSHTSAFVACNAIVIYSADFTSIDEVLFLVPRESGSGQTSGRETTGIITLRFNTHQITGNVIIDDTPTQNVKVGILNNNNKISTTTSTDINGDYTLLCMDGNPKQIVAYFADGVSQVHGPITPTEVP